MFMACAHAFEACDEMSSVGFDTAAMACADISSARCSVVGSCCCRQLDLEGFYCCGVNSIRQFVPLPCCSGEERVVVVILGAHWDLVLVAVCVARQYPPLLLKEIVSVNSNQVVVYLVHHGESLVLPSDF